MRRKLSSPLRHLPPSPVLAVVAAAVALTVVVAALGAVSAAAGASLSPVDELLAAAALQSPRPATAAAPSAAARARLPAVIQGRVMAKDRQVPLSYTNIIVEGTSIGTMALQDGRFWLRGLRPGTYTIKASYISYSVEEITVSVGAGEVKDIEFWLEPRAFLEKPYVVRATRKLPVLEETGTARRLSSRDIENLPLDDVVQMVALQAGVTLEDNEIHVRGGRSDDTQFIVDGLAVKDPLGGAGYGVSFNEDLINEIEVLTGGFSAEYGQAVSGIVNVSTKEGGHRLEGKLTYKSDVIAPADNDYNTDIVRATVSGPSPIQSLLGAVGIHLPGEQTFIASASATLSDTYLPTTSLTQSLESPIVKSDFFTPRANNQWNALAKLTWKFGDLRKLNLMYSGQEEISLGYFLPGEGFPRKWQTALDDYNVFTAQSILMQATWNHVLGDQSFYEITLGRNFSRLHVNKNGNDDFSTYQGPRLRFFEGPTGVFSEGSFLGGDADRWHDHYTETYTLKGDYKWVPSELQQFKTGIEFSYNEMQLIDLQDRLGSPPPGFLARSEDVFRVHPLLGAAYFQDRITYKGLILNLGLRLDAWAPGKEVDRVMDNPGDFVFIFQDMADSYHDNTYSLFGRRWKARLSPRIGVSFPVSPKDKFFFNYGHFSQWPRFNFVYPQLQTRFATGLQLLGNPNLDPKVTIQFETGVQHEFENLWSAGVTFFSNDIFGYAQSVRLDPFTIDPRDTPDPNDQVGVTVSPIRYFNADAARSLGVELTLTKRTTKWLSGSMTFELQRTTGTNSDANANFVAAELGQANSDFQTEQGIRNNPLLWDRPWSLTLNLDFSVGAHDRPQFLGWTLPPDWSANLLVRAWAGTRYTERFLREDGSVQNSPNTNGRVGPHRSSVDIKLNKYFDLPGTQRLTLFLEARNIFDHGNFRRVNPWTGRGYHRGNWDGDIAAQRLNGSPRSVNSIYYVQDVVDPSYRTDPRTVQMGVSYRW